MTTSPSRVLIAAIGVALVTGCAGSSGPSTSSRAVSPSPAGGSASPTVGVSQVPVPAESNPPGDIPDNLAFVPYRNPSGGYRFVHPEGWAEVAHGASVQFTDKLNGVSVEVVAASQPPTTTSVRRDELPRLQSSNQAFELRSVSRATLPAGPAVLIVFRRNTDPDPVTGRQYRDEVEEYLVWNHGHVVRFDLFGPVGADNVDAYRTMSESLNFS